MTPDLTIYSDKTVGKRIASNASMIISAKMVAVLLGAGSLMVAAKSLDLVTLGTVIFLHSYMLFFGEVTTFKTWQSLIRFGALDIENEDSQSLARLIKFGIKLDFVSVILAYLLSISLMGLVVLLVHKFPSLSGDDVDVLSLQKYAALYCLVVLLRQTGTADGVLRLFDRFRLLAIEAIVMPALRFIGTLYAAWAGFGLEGFLCVWFVASGVSYIVVVGLAMRELYQRRLLGLVFAAKQKFLSPRKGLWPFVIKSNIDSSIASGFGHLPQLMVMAMFGAAWSGLYKVADEVAKLLSEGFKLLDQVIYPELAKLIAQGNASKIWRIVMRASVILLFAGIVLMALLWFVGPQLLSTVFGEQFYQAAPLAVLLVPAAALMGIVAPLYPIFYAADKPERAIYVRGATLIIYIISFVVLALTIGEMAPGWAMLICNLFGVIAVLIVARATLKGAILAQKASGIDEIQMDESCITASGQSNLFLKGQSEKQLWGLSLKEWQCRSYKKAGHDPEKSPITAAINWVLSANLQKAFVQSENVALIAQGKVIAINGWSSEQASKVIGQAVIDVELSGLDIKTADDLSGDYIKALRKKEKPYALNTEVTPIKDIELKQYGSSYKGITDFVTKFFWPVPAFHFTRFCAFLKLTPNMVTTLSLVMMFVAMYFFWQGQWFWGFVTGWFMTFLDTVDGKLARTTMTYSAWGNIYDHGIDLLHPPFWYLAWYVGLGGTAEGPELLQFALIAILVGYVVDRLVEGAFIARFGFHIHVWRPINSALRFIIARRNPNMFIFMLGILASIFVAGAGKFAFVLVASWVWACIAANVLALFLAMFSRKPIVSWMGE